MAEFGSTSAQDESAPRRPTRVWDPVRRVWVEARVDWRATNGQYARQTDRAYSAQLMLPGFERGAA